MFVVVIIHYPYACLIREMGNRDVSEHEQTYEKISQDGLQRDSCDDLYCDDPLIMGTRSALGSKLN